MHVRGREVVTEPTWFPSFSPEDFPACLEAAQKSLALARQAIADDRADPQVTNCCRHLSFPFYSCQEIADLATGLAVAGK